MPLLFRSDHFIEFRSFLYLFEEKKRGKKEEEKEKKSKKKQRGEKERKGKKGNETTLSECLTLLIN